MVGKKKTKEFIEKLTISKERKEEIRRTIENYESYMSGKRNLNGGYANVQITHITEHNAYYEVNYVCELGDIFDGNNPVKETFEDCKVYLDKTDLHLLKDKELEKIWEDEKWKSN
jgi:hypothetical protein